MESGNARWTNIQEKAVAFLKKQGFFVVLGLCALCIAIAAMVRFIPNSESAPEATPQGEEASQSGDDRLNEVMAVPTPTLPALAQLIFPTPSPSPTPTATPTRAPVKPTTKGAPPVEGSIIWGYAMDSLLYSTTLEQWTTHDGVDIAAKEGTAVHATKGGVIQRVYMDDALGVTVEIGHENDMLSIYANLAENPPVKEGQRIDAGKEIGFVGNTARNECGMASHLHFSIYVGGVPVPPTDHVLLVK